MSAPAPLDRLANWPVGNAAAAVVGPSGVLATHGPVTMDFRLASVTKPLTALGALVAVEEGALGLDDPLGQLPGADPALTELLPGATLRHLLAHASGIAADRRERSTAAGRRRIYSNAGYELIAELVAAATEIDFADYLREAVFVPLGMASTRLAGSAASAGRATVTDLSLLLGELLQPSALLHPDTLSTACSVQFAGLRGVLPGFGAQPHNDWGLGFEIRDHKQPHWTSPENSAASYGHFGRSGTMFWIDPEAGLGLVALADRDFGDWAAQAWPELSTEVLRHYR